MTFYLLFIAPDQGELINYALLTKFGLNEYFLGDWSYIDLANKKLGISIRPIKNKQTAAAHCGRADAILMNCTVASQM